MALPRLRRYDVQARFALTLALAAFVPLLAAVYEGWSHYDTTLHAVVYGDEGVFKVGFLGCVGVAAAFGLLGVALGYNSAGQRRNDRQLSSWMGFLIGGCVVSFSLVALFAFVELGVEVASG